ncbi:hypothetical protein BD408DRAFT_422752 [Parasitella parasitica]|nr:hypothetical protein BD408DRAFT_423452 [Parasitella parasitica]KAI8638656.1 hypothetical protein BD408DRAFT_422752 [Parasitella parasitica]
MHFFFGSLFTYLQSFSFLLFVSLLPPLVPLPSLFARVVSQSFPKRTILLGCLCC